MVELDKVFECIPNTPCEIVDDEIVILNMESGYYYSLNELGRFIWEKMDGKNTLNGILQEILKIYNVDECIAKNDLLEIVGELIKENLAQPKN